MVSNGAFLPGTRLLLLVLLAAKACGDESGYTNTYIVRMDQAFVPKVTSWLEDQDFKFISKISDFHIYNNTKPPPTYSIEEILQKWPGKIKSLRRIQKQYITYGEDRVEESASMPECSPQYDTSHAIESAHELGFTGQGVVMAVTDEGFKVANIMANVNLELSKNFDSENADLGPGDDSGDPEIVRIASHGNIYSSMIAGDDNPLFCGKGIAQQAVVTLLKIGSINQRDHTIATDSTKYSQALYFHRDRIDVYAMVQDVLKTGIKQGRGGKGSIFVFPSGPVGNCFPNSIYTIAVNGLLANLTVLASSRRSSAVLVSAFVGQNSRNDHAWYGYTHCVAELETSSSATAKVAGIVGLILQANPKLTWRDVQHILVNSVQNPYPCTTDWKKNAVGHLFDDVMGFGIVNATQAVLLAQHHTNVPAQVSYLIQFERISSSLSRANVTCANGCVSSVEHVVVTFELEGTPVEPFRLNIQSPGGTVSTLIDCDDLLNHTVNELKAEKMTVHFWDEPSEGVWDLQVLANCGANKATLMKSEIISKAVLVVHGVEHTQNSAMKSIGLENITTSVSHYNNPLHAFLVLLSCMFVGCFILVIHILMKKNAMFTGPFKRFFCRIRRCLRDKKDGKLEERYCLRVYM